MTELGGADRVRTGDPLLAKQVLYQLSYDPLQGLYSESIKNISQNLLCAINQDPEARRFYPVTSFDHRQGSRSFGAVSLERR